MSETEQVVTATALFLIFNRAKRVRYTQVVTATELAGFLFMRRGGWRKSFRFCFVISLYNFKSNLFSLSSRLSKKVSSYFEKVADRGLWFFFRMFGNQEQADSFPASIVIGHSGMAGKHP